MPARPRRRFPLKSFAGALVGAGLLSMVNLDASRRGSSGFSHAVLAAQVACLVIGAALFCVGAVRWFADLGVLSSPRPLAGQVLLATTAAAVTMFVVWLWAAIGDRAWANWAALLLGGCAVASWFALTAVLLIRRK